MPVLIENIVLKSRKPNFERDSVKTLGDLLNANQLHYDPGHIVYCQEDGKHYKFHGSNGDFAVDKSEVTGYFRPLDEEVKELIDTTQSELQNQLIETKTELQTQIEDSGTELQTQLAGHKELLDETIAKLNEASAKLDELYMKEHPCKASIKLMSSGYTAPAVNEKGSKVHITVQISITRDGKELDRSLVKSITLYTTQTTTLSNELIKTTKTYDAGEIGVDTTYKVKFELISGEVCEASSSIKFYPLSYFGVFSGELNISELRPVLLSSRSHTVTINQTMNVTALCIQLDLDYWSLLRILVVTN